MYAKFKISQEEVLKLIIDTSCRYAQELTPNNYQELMLNAFKTNEGEVIDGSKFQEFNFPTLLANQYDIFISHSHLDYDEAKYLATYLYREKGLRCFIDSEVWNNVEDLVSKVANHLKCSTIKEYYNIVKNVNMMLSMALMQMIDKIECCIFLETKRSVINPRSFITETYSPWLYEEIGIMNVIRQQNLSRRHTYSVLEFATDSFKPIYALDLSRFLPLAADELQQQEYYGVNWLDWLYKKNSMQLG